MSGSPRPRGATTSGQPTVCRWDGRSWKTVATFYEVSDAATADSKDAWALSFEGGRTVLRSWRDGIYDWHVYRTPVNAEPEAVSRPSEGLLRGRGYRLAYDLSG